MSIATYTACENCSKLNRVSMEPEIGSKVPVCGYCKTELQCFSGITEASFANLSTLIEKSPIPVVVDFWAPWCGPCRIFAPVFQDAARRLAGQVAFAKIDTQAHPMAGQAYSIRGIPTLILFSRGAEVDRQSGALSLMQLLQWMQGSVSRAA